VALFVMTTTEGKIGGVQVVRGDDGLRIGYRFIFDTGEVPRVVSRDRIHEVLTLTDIQRLKCRDAEARSGRTDRFIAIEAVGIREKVLKIVPGRWGEVPFDGLDPADTVEGS